MNFQKKSLSLRKKRLVIQREFLSLIVLAFFISVAIPTNSLAAPDNSFKTGTGDSERVYLNGTYVQAGIAKNGRFGPSLAPPTVAGVTWRPSGGRSNFGFVADRNRDGSWLDTDFFYPGNPLEGWGVRYDGTQFNATSGDTTAGATYSFSDVDVSATSMSVVHTTVVGSLSIAQTYTVGIGSGTFVNDQRLGMSVTITNSGASEISSLYYARVVDPDNLKDIDGSYETNNKVVAQYGTSGKTYSLVSATKSDGRQTPSGTSYVGLISTDSRSKVSFGGFGFSSNFTNMFSDNSTYKASVGSTRIEDEGMQLLMTLGSLAAGASTTFDLAYVLSETAASDSAGEDVSAPTSTSVTPKVPSSLVTFAQNGADNNSFPQSEVQGTTTKLWKNVLTRAGYTFTGWNTKADGTGTSYADQASFKFDADYITLYAQWSLIKTAPVITWANPAAITTSTALTATQLNATANVPGACTYTPALAATLPVGKQTLTCLFTPTDATKYSTISKTVEIEVLALPVITWANPAAITSGTALTATQLNATANMAGTFTYAPALATVLKAGKQKLLVTFTPTDTRLAAITKEVEIEVRPSLTPSAQSITTQSGGTASSALGSTTTDATVVVKTVGTGLEKASATRSSITVTALTTFSGLTSVVITVTDEGRSLDLTVPVTVTPLAPASATYSLASLSSSAISWSAANGATGYEVMVNGSAACTVAATSCQINIAVGPTSVVTVKSTGGDMTASATTPASYRAPAAPIEAATVNFATAKSTLSKAAKSKLDALASTVAALGLSTLQVQGHTDSVGGIDNRALSKARATATLNYLKKKLPSVKITIIGFGPNQPAADNDSDEGRATNRRAVVLIG